MSSPTGSAGSGYVVAPASGSGPGVLIKLGFVPDGPYEENGEVRDLYRLTPAARQPWAKLASMAGGGAS